jgi:hypothetical protein
MSAEYMDVPVMKANDSMDAPSNILTGAVAHTRAPTPSATTVRSPLRSPSRIPSRIPSRSPVRRSDGFEIVCTTNLDITIGQEEEEVEVAEGMVGADSSDDSIKDDNGMLTYMLCLDRQLVLLEKAHVLEGEREEDDGGYSGE